VASLALTGVMFAFGRDSRAEQFVVMDATFTYTWDMATNSRPSRSHFYVNENNFLTKTRPTNWMSPIDYRNGTVHIRTEVLEKPEGAQPAGWALCYVANSGGYGCPYTNYYTAKGVYDRDVSMKTFYNNATLNWQQGIKQIDLVYTINGSGSGHITNFPNLKDAVTPTKVRITMIQVSAGSTYDPKAAGFDGVSPVSPPPETPRDGGAGVDGASTSDASGSQGGQSGQAGEGGQSGNLGSGGTNGSMSGSGGGSGSASGGSSGSTTSTGGTIGGGSTPATGGTSGGTPTSPGSASGGSGGGRPSSSAGSSSGVSGGCAMTGAGRVSTEGRGLASSVLAAGALAFGLALRARRRRRTSLR
jgi:hypothetical protein